MNALNIITEQILTAKWHWFHYHFKILYRENGVIHPLCQSIADCCEICEPHIPGFTNEFAKRLSSYKDKEKCLPHYEQIIQILAELYVMTHLMSVPLLDEYSYIYEPTSKNSKKNPELGMYSNSREIYIEVKCSALIKHSNNMSNATIQLPTRMEKVRTIAKSILKPEETLVLPKDNVIKDFLISANSKFSGFKKQNPNSICVLVIVWDDFIYEPISSLINKSSGLLTDNSFFKQDSQPVIFHNIDAIVIIRHSHHIVRATRDEPLADGIRHPLDWGYKQNLLPKALIPISENNENIGYIGSLFDAMHIDRLQHLSEYKPQEFIFNIKV